MIEGVEELGAKLCFEPLSNVEAFCNTSALTPAFYHSGTTKSKFFTVFETP